MTQPERKSRKVELKFDERSEMKLDELIKLAQSGEYIFIANGKEVSLPKMPENLTTIPGLLSEIERLKAANAALHVGLVAANQKVGELAGERDTLRSEVASLEYLDAEASIGASEMTRQLKEAQDRAERLAAVFKEINPSVLRNVADDYAQVIGECGNTRRLRDYADKIVAALAAAPAPETSESETK